MLAAAAGGFGAGWVLQSPFEPAAAGIGYGTSLSALWLNNHSFDLASVVLRWGLPLTRSTEALGAGISWSLHPDFCPQLLPHFPEREGVILVDFVTCSDLRAAVSTAFSTWSMNNPLISFDDVTQACELHGVGNGTNWTCPDAELIIVPSAEDVQLADAVAWVEYDLVNIDWQPYTTAGFQLPLGIGVRGSTLHVSSKYCWYLDATFCYHFFRLQEDWGPDTAALAIRLFAVVSITMAAVYLLLICYRALRVSAPEAWHLKALVKRRKRLTKLFRVPSGLAHRGGHSHEKLGSGPAPLTRTPLPRPTPQREHPGRPPPLLLPQGSSLSGSPPPSPPSSSDAPLLGSTGVSYDELLASPRAAAIPPVLRSASDPKILRSKSPGLKKIAAARRKPLGAAGGSSMAQPTGMGQAGASARCAAEGCTEIDWHGTELEPVDEDAAPPPPDAGEEMWEGVGKCEALLEYLAHMPPGPFLFCAFWLIFLPTFYVRIFLPCWDCHDFEATMAHEVGHVLGFNHPDGKPNLNLRAMAPMGPATCEEPLANVELAPNVAGLLPVTIMYSITQHLDRTCLTQDDVEGLNFLYPFCNRPDQPPKCIKPRQYSGWLRLALAVIIPFIAIVIVMFILLYIIRRNSRIQLITAKRKMTQKLAQIEGIKHKLDEAELALIQADAEKKRMREAFNEERQTLQNQVGNEKVRNALSNFRRLAPARLSSALGPKAQPSPNMSEPSCGKFLSRTASSNRFSRQASGRFLRQESGRFFNIARQLSRPPSNRPSPSKQRSDALPSHAALQRQSSNLTSPDAVANGGRVQPNVAGSEAAMMSPAFSNPWAPSRLTNYTDEKVRRSGGPSRRPSGGIPPREGQDGSFGRPHSDAGSSFSRANGLVSMAMSDPGASRRTPIRSLNTSISCVRAMVELEKLRSAHPSMLPALPDGWTEHVARDGRPYYFCKAANKSTYVRPVATTKNGRSRVQALPDGWQHLATNDGQHYYCNQGAGISSGTSALMPQEPSTRTPFPPEGRDFTRSRTASRRRLQLPSPADNNAPLSEFEA